MATDLSGEIRKRLADLRDETVRLERALSALEGGAGTGRRGPGRPPKRRGPGRPRGSGTATRTRRRRRGGTRAEQALKLVSDSPGITVPEIAKGLGIAPNYVYRVMNELQGDGKIRKRGRGYRPA